jgi:predicted DNA-binding transcriptional regulator AlpA
MMAHPNWSVAVMKLDATKNATTLRNSAASFADPVPAKNTEIATATKSHGHPMTWTGPDPLLTAKEAMAELGLSRASFYRRIDDGTIPRPLRLGSVCRWPASEIAAVIETAKARRNAFA